MNEQRWLTCGGPRPMLAYLRALDGQDDARLSMPQRGKMLTSGEMRPIERKLGLFACYCQRKKHEYYGRLNPRLQSLERDTTIGLGRDALAALDEIEVVERGRTLITRGDRTFPVTGFLQPEQACKMDAQHRVLTPRQLVAALHDIFGNPFRRVAFDPAWRTDTVVLLARQMDESRDFSTTPILADALQDAGCEDDNILSHCRGSVTHIYGCWVVDLVLGKG